MAEFIRCGCECHTAEAPGGKYHCFGPCCPQEGKPKMCPMLPDADGRPTPPIPWSLAKEIYKVYHIISSNDQTLEQIAERGGFGYEEIQYIMKRYQKKLAEAEKGTASGA